MSTGLLQKKKSYLKMAILIVNGTFNYNDKLWIELCIDRIIRFTSPYTKYKIFVWNHDYANEQVKKYLDSVNEYVDVYDETTFNLTDYNSPQMDDILTPHFGFTFSDGYNVHRTPLQILYEQALENYVVDVFFTFDNDAWPIKNNWEIPLIFQLDNGIRLTGIWRDELYPYRIKYIHPSCLGIKEETIRQLGLRFDHRPIGDDQDSLSNITVEVKNKYGSSAIYPLHRSNMKQYHHVFGGVYDNRVYHHHLGTRYEDGSIKQVKTKGSIERGESLMENKTALDNITNRVFTDTDIYILEMVYGENSPEILKILDWSEKGGTELFNDMRQMALNIREDEPNISYMILEMISNYFAYDIRFIRALGDLSGKNGNKIESESYLKLALKLENDEKRL